LQDLVTVRGEFETRVDLRQVAPRSRIAVATYTSHLLRPGGAMEVVDDYDPVDLFIEFQRQPEKFRWEYLERGPKVWRVRVTRMQPSASAVVAVAVAGGPRDQREEASQSAG